MIAQLHCSHRFHVAQRAPDEPIFDAAFQDLLRLHKGGVIEGAFIVRVVDKSCGSDLQVTIWRERRVIADDGWLYARDPEGPDGLTHQYTWTFAMADTLPSEIVFAIQQLLFSPFDSSICAICGAALGARGGFRLSSGLADVEMVPLCDAHLAAD